MDKFYWEYYFLQREVPHLHDAWMSLYMRPILPKNVIIFQLKFGICKIGMQPSLCNCNKFIRCIAEKTSKVQKFVGEALHSNL